MNFSFRAHGKCVLATALALLTLCISLDGFATVEQLLPTPTHHREIVTRQPFNQVEIHGNVHVVLTMEKTQSILVEGTENVVDAVLLEIIKGKLVIRAGQRSSNKIPTIYLPAASLQRIHFNGDGTLYSLGVIQHPAMAVILNGTVDVHVTSASPLQLDTTDAYELAD